MFSTWLLFISSTLLGLTSGVYGLGYSCECDLGPGKANPNDPYWLETIKHQGTAPLNPDPIGYKVFRSVKDFGAKGDGKTDDTVAINNAISEGSRCGGGTCGSSTISPALVYFPQGIYLVSAPLIALYYTQLVGDPKNPPALLTSPDFTGFAVIDADPYIPGGNGSQFYINQNNFFRSVRNFVIDLRKQPANATATGIHWQVSQATSLINIVFEMSTEPGNNHQGLFMENGSGGFMGDLIFNGGKYGLAVGNQQFTVRNITANNVHTAVFAFWNWGWTFQGVTVNNCQVAFNLTTGGLTPATQTVGSEVILDAVIHNTPVFVSTTKSSNGSLAGSIVLNNIKLINVLKAVAVQDGVTVLKGGTKRIKSWAQGNIYTGSNPKGEFIQGYIASPHKPSSLVDSAGRIFGKTHPQYVDYSLDQIVSVKDHDAKGDGKSDDTDAIQGIFDKYAGCKIIFFDAGTYIVTDTIHVPADVHIVGEAWSVITGAENFNDRHNPKVVLEIGECHSEGVVEITDMVFGTVGPAAGAIVVEWNVHEPRHKQGGAGMWDSHIRLGGVLGTKLDLTKCGKGNLDPNCSAAFMSLHLAPDSSAYLEGTWVWTADHDLDHDDGHGSQISLFSGRGIFSESSGPVWMVGAGSEHNVLYQYSLHNANDHYMGLIQTETPYYQPVPKAPAPFSSVAAYHDPVFTNDVFEAWGLYMRKSDDILVFGAGHYSFFNNYTQACIDTHDCQKQIVNMDSASNVKIYGLSTIATTYQLSIDEKGVINQADNINGFQSTVTAWSP